MLQIKKERFVALAVPILIFIAGALCALVLLTGCSGKTNSSDDTQAGNPNLVKNGEDALPDSLQDTRPSVAPDTNIPDSSGDGGDMENASTDGISGENPDNSTGAGDATTPTTDNNSGENLDNSADRNDPTNPSMDSTSGENFDNSTDVGDADNPTTDNNSGKTPDNSADGNDPTSPSMDGTSGENSNNSAGGNNPPAPSTNNISSENLDNSAGGNNPSNPSTNNHAPSAETTTPTTVPQPTKKPTPTPAPTKPPTKSPTPKPTASPTTPKPDKSGSNGSVSANGQLQVIGTQLSNADGSPIVLRGVSTHGIAWFPDFATKAFMQTLKEEWGATVFRIAMYSYEGNDSYINNPSWNKTKVCSLIDAAIDLDMYVIVDWHILADGNPQTHQKQASEFFTYIASTYPGVPNILYEICNEPNGGASWSGNIKPYANEIIPVIRKYSPDAVILVGTPTWSQDVDAAAADPLTFDNVMYALHFYAGTHKEWLRSKADTALAKGLALFVTEWGTTDASGNGAVDKTSSNEWLTYLEKNQISWCNWSLCNKSESSALLLPSASTNGALPDSSLSESGKYIKEKMLEYSGTTPVEHKPQDSTDASGQKATPTPSPATTKEPSGNSGTGNTAGQNPPASSNTGLTLLYYNENREDSTNTISPRFQIKNNTGNDISLDKLTIRYYYTPEKDITQCFFCDYADVNGSSYRAITSNVNAVFLSGSDSCMQITFSSGAGTLAPGDTATLQIRITNEDWSNYIQSNDASFSPDAASYTENDHAALISK